MTQTRGENRLISLVIKAKSACQNMAQAVRNDLRTIDDARDSGMTWVEIADGLGFPGKDREIRKAYSREIRKQKTEKRIGEEKKPTPEPGIQPDPLPAGTSSSKLRNPESRDSGERTGPITLLPRGHFRIEPDRSDDKL